MRSGKSHDKESEEPRPRAVLHRETQADVGPLVWWWDGHRWHGPKESGDYGAVASQSRSRS